MRPKLLQVADFIRKRLSRGFRHSHSVLGVGVAVALNFLPVQILLNS